MPNDRSETPGTRYEQDLVPVMFEPFAADLVERLDLHENMRVADVGCGTGIIARMVGEKLNEASVVIGIDINAAMLDVARAKSKALPCEIIWHESSADNLPLDDASIDLLVSQHAFMLFPDKPAAAHEMHRVLRDGGNLYVAAWRHYSHQPHYVALVDELDRLVSAQAAKLIKGAFQYQTEDEIRAPLIEGGFQDVRVDTVRMDIRFPSADQFVRIVVAGSILARMGIEIDDDVLEELCSRVSNALTQYETAGGLVVPMESYLASSVR